MAYPVRIHPQFKVDLAAHLRRLRDEGWMDRIARMRADLRDARRLLGRFPDLGTIEKAEDDATLRRLILRHVPYVIWFVTTETGRRREVLLLRLFHARQARPRLKTRSSRR